MNNIVKLIGEIVSEPRYSHEVFGEKFYFVDLMVRRLSGNADVIPLMVPERLTDISSLNIGVFVEVDGQFRSFNKSTENGKKLILSVFTEAVKILPEAPIFDHNFISLEGYICKEPTFRTTPFGREISDLLIAVNRPHGKSDYIPCIVWGRNAKFASSLDIGQSINVWGRVQSREYVKKIEDGTGETRTCYEVSISKIYTGSEVAQHEE